MSQSNTALGRAYGRAAADIGRGTDKQADIVRLLHQIADIQSARVGTDGMRYVVAAGAHNARFRIAVAITPSGQVGWSLV